MTIKTITKENRTIVQVGFEDEIRKDMQEKLMQVYDTQSPIKDFSLYYPFEPDELEDWEAILDWKSISDNKQIKWSPKLIRRFCNKWDWLSLWMNKSVLCWDAELLEEFKDKINWDVIVWSSVNWTKKLHEKFEKHLTWSRIKYDYEMVKQHTSHNRTRFFFKASNSNFSNSFMELYLFANSFDDVLGIFILYNTVNQYFNNKINNPSYPL